MWDAEYLNYSLMHFSKLMFAWGLCFFCRIQVSSISPMSETQDTLTETCEVHADCKHTPLHFTTSTGDFTSMDFQVHSGSPSTPVAQQPAVPSILPSPELWSSTSFQSPTSHEVLSISSLVPSTVLTLLPHSNGNFNPEPPSFSQPESQPAESSSPVNSESPDLKTLTSPGPWRESPPEAPQRKPSDGGPLEEGSVGLMLPKDLPEEEPGMVIITG